MRSREHNKPAAKVSTTGAVSSGSVHRTGVSPKGEKLKNVLLIAQQRGLFRGARTKVVRGRMPEALVSKAKARTGIQSDTALLEVALANLAVADDYPEWLLSRRGTVSQDIDLEF
ncbi:MAG: hypothetical protein ACR2L2_10940 [Acidobacteriota bacterium]